MIHSDPEKAVPQKKIMLDNVMEQFNSAADRINLNPNVNNTGVKIEELFEYTNNNKGSIVDFPGAKPLDNINFFALDCDIFVPAALGNQIIKKMPLGQKLLLS